VMSHDTAGPRQSAGVLMHACDAAIDVASAALQVHGGYGYLKEYSPERLLRDAVSLRGASAAWGHSSAEFEAPPR
ncbi:MAG: acyl-CoA dehydrogenase family protein, partial [Mycetocola sp.]